MEARWSTAAVTCLAVLTVFALAGCIGGAGESSEASDVADGRESSGSEADRTAWESWSDETELTVTEVRIPQGTVVVGVTNGNAWVLEAADPLPIRNASLEVTWTPDSPLTEDLEVRAHVDDADDNTRIRESKTGSSPLSLELGSVTVPEGGRILVSVHAAGPAGASIQQDVDLGVSFEHPAGADPG